ncbi:hypothetical protein [Flammeovirga sp. EKP202]|uniref:hypothetical protein n=1 Tax=Flammeovirga sp. EKP202 TaxID=2770592 RepID=UPI00165F2122|nr:hypothetical protein [Flammeovirga sp. EKP202]MBD0405484.1 hypothetical protein [Flammeovirga sp. EKP202]
MENKKCLYCQKPITIGRVDKKFCSSSCRYAYNNTLSMERYSNKVSHKKIIDHNYNILKSLSPKGKGTVRRSTVEEMGYNFKFFTSFYRTNKQKTYFFCYDLGYAPILDNGKEKLLIVTWQKYMERYDFNPWKGVQ